MLGEAPVAASPGGYDQNRAKMIGIPLPLQVAAISVAIRKDRPCLNDKIASATLNILK